MSIEIVLPDIGSDEVNVTEILVKVGDHVTQDQSLMTVEGDKASMEIPSPQAGVIISIDVALGDQVKTGQLIMHFDAVAQATPEQTQIMPSVSDSSLEQPMPIAVAETTTASIVKEIMVPDIGNDPVEVTEILVKIGDTVIADQSLITVEGDKASMEIPAPFAGVVLSIDINCGDKVQTGSIIMSFDSVASKAVSTSVSDVSKAPQIETVSNIAHVSIDKSNSGEAIFETFAYAHATPLVRRLAREFGVDLSKIKGTGNRKRITKEDVQDYVKQAVLVVESGRPAQSDSGLGLIPWPTIDFSKFGEIESKPLSRIQKLSGANLHRNWVKIPHVTQWDDADITELEEFRQQQNKLFAKKSAKQPELAIKITPLVFILKAVATALERHPTFNSALSEDNEQLILKKYINIGVAVDTPNGLVVPVLRDVNKKGILELSQDLMFFSKKARDGKLTSTDMSGGCFTISSLGGIGGTAFTPIINAPEVAILGVSKSQTKPIWDGVTFQPRLILPLSLSYDHRVIDGAEGARFISTLGSLLGDIRQLIL